jgi:hypothetical protein
VRDAAHSCLTSYLIQIVAAALDRFGLLTPSRFADKKPAINSCAA